MQSIVVFINGAMRPIAKTLRGFVLKFDASLFKKGISL
jgi:hypothetical protein